MDISFSDDISCNNIVTSTPKAVRRKHQQSNDRDLTCPICLKKYQRKFAFEVHVQSHTVQPAPPVGRAANNAVQVATPNVTTTPQQSNDLVCPVCSKKYVKKFAYDQHVKGHSIQTAPSNGHAVNITVQSNGLAGSTSMLSILNDTDQDGFRVPSAPVPSQKKKASGPAQHQPKKKKPKKICTYCLKEYACPYSFKNHLKIHQLEASASRFPKDEDILGNCVTIGDSTLDSVSKCISVGDSGESFARFVEFVKSNRELENQMQTGTQTELTNWEKFCQRICEELIKSFQSAKKFLLPSALLSAILDDHEKLVNDFQLCDILLQHLKYNEFDLGIPDCVGSQFILEFSLSFVTEMLKFIGSTFQKNLPRKRFERRTWALTWEPDLDARQLIYFIGGSTIRKFFRKGHQYKTTEGWQQVCTVLKSNLLREKPDGDIDPDSEWTVEVDRGGLLYITPASQRFFVNLTKVIYRNETNTGSIDYDSVIRQVCHSPLCAEWDLLIGDALPETVSLTLLSEIVTQMCRTCGTGFAKRRFHKFRERPVASLTTRHLAASRKNR